MNGGLPQRAARGDTKCRPERAPKSPDRVLNVRWENGNRKSLFMRVANPLADARIANRICLFVVALSALPAGFTYAADLNQNLKSGTPSVVAQGATSKDNKGAPKASPVAPNANGAEIVGKLLANPPSDPDVPLPQGGLATRPPAGASSDRPTVFGRQEEGGGVFGLKIPIPADRGTSDRHTRSGAGLSGAD